MEKGPLTTTSDLGFTDIPVIQMERLDIIRLLSGQAGVRERVSRLVEEQIAARMRVELYGATSMNVTDFDDSTV